MGRFFERITEVLEELAKGLFGSQTCETSSGEMMYFSTSCFEVCRGLNSERGVSCRFEANVERISLSLALARDLQFQPHRAPIREEPSQSHGNLPILRKISCTHTSCKETVRRYLLRNEHVKMEMSHAFHSALLLTAFRPFRRSSTSAPVGLNPRLDRRLTSK